MFPLGTVLLPGGILPLHVFEPRYRQLVIDCLADDDGDPEFGVTMIERGWEVGGGDTRSDVGVVARMVQIEALPDGRYAVVAVGTRRIRVLAWLPDDPYPLADVDDWPDDEPDADGLSARVDATRVRLGEVLDLAVRAGDLRAVPELTLGDDPAVGLLPPRRAGADRPRRPLPLAQRAVTRRCASTCSARRSTTWKRCCVSDWPKGAS